VLQPVSKAAYRFDAKNTFRNLKMSNFRCDSRQRKNRNAEVFDYVVLNGVFNYRGEIPFDRMLAYWQDVLVVAFKHARTGLAFNVMSPHVDWTRDDLFHLPLDTMSAFVWSRLTRFFVVRHDYRACEYVTYLYRTPVQFPPGNVT